MTADLAELVKPAVAGIVMAALQWLGARRRRSRISRQVDRLESKVNVLLEDSTETQHRLSRIEDVMGFTPTGKRRARAAGLD